MSATRRAGVASRGGLRPIPTFLVAMTTALLWGAVVAWPGSLGAQSVIGAVRDSATAAPLPGVLVSVLDPEGERVRAVLSDEAGRFAMEIPLGRYRLRAERIGLRPSTTEPFGVSAFRAHRVDVEMTDRAVEIAGLVVDARVQSCRLDARRATVIQRWWGEIRTALDVSAVLQRQRFADFRLERFEREWDRRVRDVIAESRREEVSLSSRPFVSEEANFLAEGGYVQGEVQGQRSYFAPDADVLLSNVFLRDHCFSLVEADEERYQLGLRFEPTDERGVTGITGTLWVDTTTAELRHLDFRYEEIEGIPDNDGGGRVTFEYLPNGAWIVSAWFIRMPKLSLERIRRGRPRYRVVGYVDVGGEVEALPPEPSRGPPGAVGSVRGVVFDSIRGVGLPDAEVRVLGTGLHAITDPTGAFTIPEVPVGRHHLTFSHPDLDAWGVYASFAQVRVQDGEIARARLTTPGFRRAALALCLGAGRVADAAMVGHLLGPRREPLAGVPVEVAWPRDPEEEDGPEIASPTVTDAEGRFVVCTVPGGATVRVRARIGERWMDLLEVVAEKDRITYREVWLTR